MSQEELNIALNNLGGIPEEPRDGDQDPGLHDYDVRDFFLSCFVK